MTEQTYIMLAEEIILNFYDLVFAEIARDEADNIERLHRRMTSLCLEEKMLPSYSLWTDTRQTPKSRIFEAMVSFVLELTRVRNVHFVKVLDYVAANVSSDCYELKRGYFASSLYPDSKQRFMKDIDIVVSNEATALRMGTLLASEFDFEKCDSLDLHSNLYILSLPEVRLPTPHEGILLAFSEEVSKTELGYSPVLFVDIEIQHNSVNLVQKSELERNLECIGLALGEVEAKIVNMKHLLDAFLARGWIDMTQPEGTICEDKMGGELFCLSPSSRNLFTAPTNPHFKIYWEKFKEYLKYCEDKYEQYLD